MAPFIRAQDVSLVFKAKDREPVTALSNFSLDIAQGEFVSIVGPSGCGKSTFLNIVLGLIEPAKGVVQLNGTRISGPARSGRWCFKNLGCYPGEA